MLGFTIKPSRNAKAKSGDAKFEAETKMEFFVKTEAESNYQKQDVMDFDMQLKKRTEAKRRKKVTLNDLFMMLTDDEFSELMHKIGANTS